MILDNEKNMLSSKTKRELKIDQRQILIDSIEIGIPSPQQILTWGERSLPNGKRVGLIKNSKTVNYKRFTPFRDGLFCERIFGPVTSFVCACGKKQPYSKVTFCEKCEVEYIDSRSRRYRLGYISLLSPVTHLWYLKGRPGYLSLFLGKRKKTVVALAYCNAYLISHVASKKNISMANLLTSTTTTTKLMQATLASEQVQIFDLQENLDPRKGHVRRFVLATKSGYQDRKTGIGVRNQSIQKSCEAGLSLWPYMRSASNYNSDFFFQDKRRSVILSKISSKVASRTKTSKACHKKNIVRSTEPHIDSRFCFLTRRKSKRLFFLTSLQSVLQRPYKFLRTRTTERTQSESKIFALQKKKKFLSSLWSLPICGSKKKRCKTRSEAFKTRTKIERSHTCAYVSLLPKVFFGKAFYKSLTSPNLFTCSVQGYKSPYKYKALRTNFPFARKALFTSSSGAIPGIAHYKERKKLCLRFCRKKSFTAHSPTTFLQKIVFKEAQKKIIKKKLNLSCETSAYAPFLYARQQTLPFLPSLVCHFYLRDALLNFSHSLATPEDFPLMEYCDTKKWEPLRDVHRFMAHRTVEAFKEEFSYGVTRSRKAFRSRHFSEDKLDGNLDSLPRAFFAKSKVKSHFFSGYSKGLHSTISRSNASLAPLVEKKVSSTIPYKSFCKAHQTKRNELVMLYKHMRTNFLTSTSTSTSTSISTNGHACACKASRTFVCQAFFAEKIRRIRKKISKDIDSTLIKIKTKSTTDFSKSNPKASLPEESNKSALSGLELIASREILSYTGGGALQQLLQQFNSHELSKFLFAESQILRVLYESKNGTEITKKNKVNFVETEASKSQVLQTKVLTNQVLQTKASQLYYLASPLQNEMSRSTKKCNRLQIQNSALPFFLRDCTSFKLSKKEELALLFSRAFGTTKYKKKKIFQDHKSENKNKRRDQTNSTCFSLHKAKAKLFAKCCERLKQHDLTFRDRTKSGKYKCLQVQIFLQIKDLYLQKNLPKIYQRFVRGQLKGSFISVKGVSEARQKIRAFVKAPREVGLFLHTKGVRANRVLQLRYLYEETKIQNLKLLARWIPQIKKPRQRRAVLDPFCSLPALPLFALSASYGGQNLLASTSTKLRQATLAGEQVQIFALQRDLYPRTEHIRRFTLVRKAENIKADAKQIELSKASLFNTIVEGPGRNAYLGPQNIVRGRSILPDRFLPVKSPADLRKKQMVRISRRIYKVARRLKIASLLTRNHRKPEWMILSHLPVLPPDLRPILQMSEKVVVASDLNIMYQRVIYRNNRHLRVRFIDFHLVTAIQRLVQDAVDRLIENGKGGTKPYYTQAGRPLKSLSDILKGKKGRFRLNLLGKRVDFSGRSVIVVSPLCQIHECGLPKEIALELYHYFLLRTLIVKRYCASIVTAKKMIKSKSSKMWDILRIIMYHHPVLLNRAPTLHRLGIQAFQPKLVLGNAIALHPLVCSGFNADFDGDQMGVHLPLSFAARAESLDLLWSRNNLLSPATGQPMLVPSQDMVLGFYYITARAFITQKKKELYSEDALPNESIAFLRAFKTTKLLQIVERVQVFLQSEALYSFPPSGVAHICSLFGKFLANLLTTTSITTNSCKSKISERFVKKFVLAAKGSTFKVQDQKSFDNGAFTRRKSSFVNPITVVRESENRFLNVKEITRSFETGQIKLHQPVWLSWTGKIENDEGSQKPLELRVQPFGIQGSVYEIYIWRGVFTKAQAKINRIKNNQKSHLYLPFAGYTCPINFGEKACSCSQSERVQIFDLFSPLRDAHMTPKPSKGSISRPLTNLRFVEQTLLSQENSTTQSIQSISTHCKSLQIVGNGCKSKICQRFANDLPKICHQSFRLYLKAETCFVRTTAGRVLMNNLLKTKKPLSYV